MVHRVSARKRGHEAVHSSGTIMMPSLRRVIEPMATDSLTTFTQEGLPFAESC